MRIEILTAQKAFKTSCFHYCTVTRTWLGLSGIETSKRLLWLWGPRILWVLGFLPEGKSSVTLDWLLALFNVYVKNKWRRTFPPPVLLHDLYRDNCTFYRYAPAAWGNSPMRPGPPESWGVNITHNDTPQSVWLLWTRDRPVAETCTWQHNSHNTETSMFPMGFEPVVPASEQP